MPGLPRTVKLAVPLMRGTDIDGHARAMHRYLRDSQLYNYELQPDIMRRTYGIGKRTLAKKCAEKAGLPQYGVVGPALYAAMRDAGAYDQIAEARVQAYADSLAPKPVVLPVASLHSSLWTAYSDALTTKGLFSLGTYNPASKLPSGLPSDHAVYPAYAFDIGFDPDTGWANPVARAYAERTAKRLEVEYVILGNKIHIDGAWKTYTGGGHLDHVHVSGRR